MPRLQAVQARRASIRVRALTHAYQDFAGTLRCIDRLEQLGRRIGSPLVVDLMVEVRGVIIDACSPGLRVGSRP